MSDLIWYLLGALIMSLIFISGYKIGHIRGWHHGYSDYGTILEQRSRFRPKPKPENEWDYQPVEKRNGSPY